jgi:hypothetical protein
VLSIMGGAELDFQHAEVAERDTTIRVFTIMGGAELRFPPGVDVQVSKFALMGGHDVTLDEMPPPAGSPVFHVHLFSLMGGAEIRQGPKPRNWIERRRDQRRIDRSAPSEREPE